MKSHSLFMLLAGATSAQMQIPRDPTTATLRTGGCVSVIPKLLAMPTQEMIEEQEYINTESAKKKGLDDVCKEKEHVLLSTLAHELEYNQCYVEGKKLLLEKGYVVTIENKDEIDCSILYNDKNKILYNDHNLSIIAPPNGDKADIEKILAVNRQPYAPHKTMYEPYITGKAEVPTFDRALFSIIFPLKCGLYPNMTHVNEVPVEIIKDAIETDKNLTKSEKEILVRKIDDFKSQPHNTIKRNENNFFLKVLFEAIDSIDLSCIYNEKGGALRKLSLSNSSAYHPMEWDHKKKLKEYANKANQWNEL